MGMHSYNVIADNMAELTLLRESSNHQTIRTYIAARKTYDRWARRHQWVLGATALLFLCAWVKPAYVWWYVGIFTSLIVPEVAFAGAESDLQSATKAVTRIYPLSAEQLAAMPLPEIERTYLPPDQQGRADKSA